MVRRTLHWCGEFGIFECFDLWEFKANVTCELNNLDSSGKTATFMFVRKKVLLCRKYLFGKGCLYT